MPESRFPKEAISNPKFVYAVRELKKHRLWFDLPSPYQIKISKFNYFWTTGKITVDGSGKITQRDIGSFIALVEQTEKPRAALPIKDQCASAVEPPSIPAAAFLDLTEFASGHDLTDNTPTIIPPWE